MKYLVYLFCLISSGLSAQVIDEQWMKDNYIKKEHLIKMRDGVSLFTAVYMPKSTDEKHPVIMIRTPYSCAPYGEDKMNTRLYETHWKEYLKENYIFVIQDVRGRWMSEGEFVDVRPFKPYKLTKKDFDESSDTYDTVDWLVKNLPENNGNVGVFGISYPGFYATMAALAGHPAIKAVSPQAPVTDWFIGDDFHHNGALALDDAFSFYSGFGQPRPKPTTTGPTDFHYYTKDNYKFFLETGALPNFTKLMGDSIKFWNDIMNHPDYDAWWQERDARTGCKNIKPAILVVGGLFDAEDCFGGWRLYEAIAKQSPETNYRLVEGPWFHGGWARSDGSYLGNVRFGAKTSSYYQTNIELPFFNYYLKGKGNIDSVLSKATIFFTGENSWKTFDAWPPKDVAKTPMYFNENGALSFRKSKAENSFTSYISDPSKPVPYSDGIKTSRTREYMTDDQRFASSRPDVISFKSRKLENDLTIAGTITADLKVSISTTDADFVVKVIDIFPEGFSYDTLIDGKGNGKDYLMDSYQMLIRGEIMRGKYRNSFQAPQAFEQNQVTTVKFDLPDVAHTFKKGHRIMIQVQSSWFPLFDRNPQQYLDIYHCNDSDFIKAEVKIYHDAANASSILLPMLIKQ